MKKKKVFIFIIIFIILLAIYATRNFMIVQKYVSALYEFRHSNNHYYLWDYKHDKPIMEVYYKDGKAKQTAKLKEDDGSSVEEWSIYTEENDARQIMVIPKTQIFSIYENVYSTAKNGNIPYNYVIFEYDKDYLVEELPLRHRILSFLYYAFIPVVPAEYEGVDCYVISQFPSSKIYVSKENYLPVATTTKFDGNEQIYTYELTVDTVTDSDVEIPDLSEYTQMIQGEN